jgi:hypothetical protein
MSKISINYVEKDMQLMLVLTNTDGATYTELRDAFDNFLRGIGYVIDDVDKDIFGGEGNLDSSW